MIAFFALLLDALIGDPKWLWSHLPHPAVLFGMLISWGDERFNDEDDPESTRRANGILCTLALVVVAVVAGLIIAALPFGEILSILLAAVLLAQRSLVDHVNAVADALRLSVRDGQIMVARIVGRDTTDMDSAAVSRAAIESAAENFSDGVTAPLFWLVLGGLPGLLVYKAVNTADSMIGYRTPRHEAFGMASARLDDALNWIPARLTAALFLLAGKFSGRPSFAPGLVADAGLHRSLNAGWPEAALSRVLGVALAGPRSYQGSQRDYPWVNDRARQNATPDDIETAVKMLWRTWLVLAVAVFLIALF